MRNALRYILGCVATILIAACNTQQDDSNFRKVHSEIKEIPKIEIQLLDSTVVSLNEKLAKGKITLLYYFDPDCHHCKTETVVLLRNKTALQKAHIAFLSNANLNDIRKYNSNYDISSRENTVVGKDIKYSFTKFIKKGAFPLLIMYDKDGKLKRVFSGEIDDNELTKNLNSEI